MGKTDTRERLETERLVLEPLLPRHAEEMFAPLQDKALYRFIPQEPPVSVAALRERYERLAGGRSAEGDQIWLNWAARDRASNAVVGTFQATVYTNGTADIAYVVFVAAQRRGVGLEGCTGKIRHLERDLGVGMVAAEIDTRNVASIALVERLGFRRVKTTRDADYFKGTSSDEYRYERRLRPGG